MLQSISDQLSFWLDKNATTKDVAEKRLCVRQLDILEYDLNLTKIKLPPLQGTSKQATQARALRWAPRMSSI